MYTDDQLADMRFQISRALEAVHRQIDASHGDKAQLQDAYEALDVPRSKLSSVVWEIPTHSMYNAAFTTAYNEVDQAAQDLSFAMGGSEDDRPGHLATTAQHILAAVSALVS